MTRRLSHSFFLAVFSVFLFCLPPAYGTESENEAPVPDVTDRKGWGRSVTTAYLHQFSEDVDGGGEFTKDSGLLQLAVRYQLEPGRSFGISVGYGVEHYDFSGGPGAGTVDVWDNIHTIRLGFPVTWRLDERWRAFVMPGVRFQGDADARFGDSISGGGFVGLSYSFNERLTIGPGFGVVSQLEDDPSLFPILIVDWQISDHWSFSTGRGLGASLGPGFVIAWEPVDNWRFGGGARYEKFRFRLAKDNAAAPHGVGEDRSLPVFLTAEFSPNPGFSASAIVGVQEDGELRLDGEEGDRLRSSDYGSAVFLGATLNLRF